MGASYSCDPGFDGAASGSMLRSATAVSIIIKLCYFTALNPEA